MCSQQNNVENRNVPKITQIGSDVLKIDSQT